MNASNFKRGAILTVVLVVIAIGSWELYLRHKGYPVSYNDDESLWCTWRKKVYQPTNTFTVFIGSSRIKYDLDINTWKQLTGEDAIQLSFVGTSPRALLNDLADDADFKGNLVIDVTEGLFFGRDEPKREKSARDAIEYYKKWTPAQKFSASINYYLESQFVFLEKNKFSLNELLDRLPVPKRKAVFIRPKFPLGFFMCRSTRQSFMTEGFVNDTIPRNIQINNWKNLGSLDTRCGISGDSLTDVFRRVKIAIDKIKARGGGVWFIRTPSSGGYFGSEQIAYPRDKYWDPMLVYTNTQGIYFKDYPELASLTCPEWSHLSQADAIVYTRALVKILEQKGWVLSNKQSPTLNHISSQNL